MEELKREMSTDEKLGLIWNEGVDLMFLKIKEHGLDLDFLDIANMVSRGSFAFLQEELENIIGEKALITFANSELPVITTKTAMDSFALLLKEGCTALGTTGMSVAETLYLITILNTTLFEILNDSVEREQKRENDGLQHDDIKNKE